MTRLLVQHTDVNPFLRIRPEVAQQVEDEIHWLTTPSDLTGDVPRRLYDEAGALELLRRHVMVLARIARLEREWK